MYDHIIKRGQTLLHHLEGTEIMETTVTAATAISSSLTVAFAPKPLACKVAAVALLIDRLPVVPRRGRPNENTDPTTLPHQFAADVKTLLTQHLEIVAAQPASIQGKLLKDAGFSVAESRDTDRVIRFANPEGTVIDLAWSGESTVIAVNGVEVPVVTRPGAGRRSASAAPDPESTGDE